MVPSVHMLQERKIQGQAFRSENDGQQQCVIAACAEITACQCCKSVSKSADISSRVRASIVISAPIGRGQREVIIGTERTGKTAIAIEMSFNQNPFFLL